MIYRDPEPGPPPWVAGICFVAALGIAGTMDHEDAETEFRHHCKMFEIHERSGGEYGWPDPDNKQDECEEILDEDENAKPVGQIPAGTRREGPVRGGVQADRQG